MSPSQDLSELIKDIKEQVRFAQEMGVGGLAVELSDAKTSADDVAIANRRPADVEDTQKFIELKQDRQDEFAPASLQKSAKQPKPASRPRAGERLSNLPPLPKRSSTVGRSPRESILAQNAGMAVPSPAAAEESLFGEIGPALPATSETIEDIRVDIGNCVRCPLHQGRTQVVHTTGNFQADLMFVGEAPGADEDAQGFPFVGRAGQLLTKIIEAIGMTRDQVAIGNINRCRPPGNRQPTIDEAHTCRPFLLREIAVIRPKVIVVLGNTAMHNLLDTKVGITKMRGHFHDYFGVKVMPTFHPAYLLRDPSKKREVWEDMKKVKAYLMENGK